MLGYIPNMGGASVSVVDLDRLEVIDEVLGFALPWGAVASRDGRKLFVDDSPSWSPRRSVVAVVDLAARSVTRRIPTRGLVESALSHSGRFVFSSSISGSSIGQIDTESDEVIRVLRAPMPQEAETVDDDELWVVGL